MSAWSDIVTAGFKDARTVAGIEFIIGAGTTRYSGIQRDTADLLPLIDGGFPHDYAGGLEYLTSEATLVQGNTVTIYAKGGATGTQYRVESFTGSADDPVKVALLIGVTK